MKFVLFIFGSLLVLMLVSGIYVFVAGCVRRKEIPWLVKEKIDNTPYKKYYKYIQQANQWLIEHDAQDICIINRDGLKLHGLWVPTENARGTVLLAHGYRSTMLLDFGMAFYFYHKQGLNLLIPEQRSHGKSQGVFITFGVKESEDMLEWLKFHNRRHSTLPVILSGLSMGASTVMYLADKQVPPNVCGIVADCGFTSPKEILASVFTKVTHLPSAPSLWVTELCARVFARFSLTQCDTRDTLARSHLPILMIHGLEDGFVPCEMTKEGYAACTSAKQLLLVEGADHGISFLVDKDRYTKMVIDFLDANIGR